MRRYLAGGQQRQQAHCLCWRRGQSNALGSERLRLLFLLLLVLLVLLLLPGCQWRCGRSMRLYWRSVC